MRALIFDAYLLILTILQETHGLVTFEVKMVRYENYAGDTGDGECCDYIWFSCNSNCDYSFTFCLDEVRNPINRNTGTCTYFRSTTGELGDGTSYTFGSRMGGIRNPIGIEVNRTDTVVLKTYVEDIDIQFHDWVDTLHGELSVPSVGRDSSAPWIEAEIQGSRSSNPTKLKLQFRAYCRENYFGDMCQTFCEPQDSDSDGHYTCHPDTGNIVCTPGWTSRRTRCKTRNNPCTSSSCRNGGTCRGDNGAYTCSCRPGYTGRRCETRNRCHDNPCQHGGSCRRTSGGFRCACLPEYTGDRCEVYNVDLCDSQPCLNAGECSVAQDAFSCKCAPTFTGAVCGEEINVPDEHEACDTACYNGGTCVSPGLCLCLPCYTEAQCEVQVCDSAGCRHLDSCRVDNPAPSQQHRTPLLHKWAIVGLIGGVVVAVVVASAVGCVCHLRRRKRNQRRNARTAPTGPTQQVAVIHTNPSATYYLDTGAVTLSTGGAPTNAEPPEYTVIDKNPRTNVAIIAGAAKGRPTQAVRAEEPYLVPIRSGGINKAI